MIRVGLINGKSVPAEASVDSQSLTETQNKLKVVKTITFSLNLTSILYIFTLHWIITFPKLTIWKKDNLRVVNLKEVGWILWSWLVIIGQGWGMGRRTIWKKWVESCDPEPQSNDVVRSRVELSRDLPLGSRSCRQLSEMSPIPFLIFVTFRAPPPNFAFSLQKRAPAWKKYTTAGGGGGDKYQLSPSSILSKNWSVVYLSLLSLGWPIK